jgi:hypothetical protein
MNHLNSLRTRGKIVYKSDLVQFNNSGKDFSYVEMAISYKYFEQERRVAFKVWDDKQDLIKGIKLGDFVEAQLTLTSEQNKKNKGLWYHKIFLKDLNLIAEA